MPNGVTESGYVLLTRHLTSRVEAPCLTCGVVVPRGTLVNWGAHFGIWHLTCDNPRAPEPDAPKVEFPPDCPYCHKPIVDPIPTTAPLNENWCRECVATFEGIMARARDNQQRFNERNATKNPEPAPVPANIGGEGYGF